MDAGFESCYEGPEIHHTAALVGNGLDIGTRVLCWLCQTENRSTASSIKNGRVASRDGGVLPG